MSFPNNENLQGFVAFIIFEIFCFIFEIIFKGGFGKPLNNDKSFGPEIKTKYVFSHNFLFFNRMFVNESKIVSKFLNVEKD